MVEAITQIGRTMGIATIAERVDSAEVLDQLAEIGVQYAQGHYIASPQPVDVLLRSWSSAPRRVGTRKRSTARSVDLHLSHFSGRGRPQVG